MTVKIQVTRDYSLFKRHGSENRPFDIRKHKRLVNSMERYGFLECYPIIAVRDSSGKLTIKDGQHRHAIAESLSLPIYYVEQKEDFDVAIVNSAAKAWVLRDYAVKHSANGIASYTEGLLFCDQHQLPMGIGFSLLAGTTTFCNCQDAFMDGSFKIKDQPWAESVASIYGPLVQMGPAMKNTRFIEACMAVCRVKEFDKRRLLLGANRCREKLVAYSTRDAYLDMLEVVYNFGRSNLFGLKAAAMMAMRERNPRKTRAQAERVAANGKK